MKFNIHKNIHKGQTMSLYKVTLSESILNNGIIIHNLGDPSSSRNIKCKIMYYSSTCTHTDTEKMYMKPDSYHNPPQARKPSQ